ncbi:MAG TPA: aspartate carbamoyltransferase catalytic subunit [Symbiobacteriaceae bacterium]
MAGLKSKDLLGLRELSAEEIELILDTAEALREIATRPIKKVPTLKGRSYVTLFYENSTRTAKSFELACKYLGADVVNVSVGTSSVKKGETLRDTVMNLEAMGVDAIIIRHPCGGAPHLAAQFVRCSIINAGDGIHEHPTQGLLDMLTIRRHKGGFRGLKVAILGDILHSRVARSNIHGLTKMGAEVWVAGPSTMLPPGLEDLGVRVTTRVEEALEGADVVNVLRIQLERMQQSLFPSVREYHRFWGLTPERLRLAKPDALLMHPGPMNRGVEISSDVADGDQSVIHEQVTNGVAVRMAVLYLLANRGEAA